MNHDAKPLMRKRRWIRRAILFVVVVALWKTVPPFGSGYTVSRETTYVTSPVGADGFIDYFAAHFELFGKDVKPEDNAALAIMRAIVPADLPPAWCAAVADADWENDGPKLTDIDASLRRKGIDPYALDKPIPSEEPKLEVDPEFELPPELKKKLGILPAPTASQWREARAMLDQWLADSDGALDRVVAASKLPAYYLRPVASPDNEMLMDLAAHKAMRAAAVGLERRSQHLMKQGDFQGACRDALALLRLGRLATQQPGLLGHRMAASFSFMGLNLMQPLIASGEVAVGDMRRGIDALPGEASLIGVTLRGERLAVIQLGPEQAYRKSDGDPHAWFMRWQTMPFDGLAQHANQYMNDVEAAAQAPDWPSRRAAAEAIVDQWDAHAALDRTWQRRVGYMTLFVLGNRSMMARARNDAFVTLLVPIIAPALRSGFETAALADGYHASLRAALACAAYREVHGQWPDRLDELVPAFLEAIPIDACSNAAISYRRLNKGFMVYTVGRNGADDGGPPADDAARDADPAGAYIDDWGYRIEVTE